MLLVEYDFIVDEEARVYKDDRPFEDEVGLSSGRRRVQLASGFG